MAKATGNRFCCSQGEWHKRFDLPFCNPCGRSDDGNCRNNRAVEVEDRRRDAPDVGNEFFPFDAVAGLSDLGKLTAKHGRVDDRIFRVSGSGRAQRFFDHFIRLKGEQDLSVCRAMQRRPSSYARRHAHRLAALDLFEVEQFVAMEDRQMGCFVCLMGDEVLPHGTARFGPVWCPQAR